MDPEQTRALRESATNIIAHEKQLENQRAKLYDLLQRVNTNARRAVMMADESARAGDAEAAARFNESAEVLARETVEIDTRIASIDIELIEARQASEEARSIASDSAIKTRQMQEKGAELRAEFERAKLGESDLDSTGTPSFDSVRSSIDERLARAEASAEIAEVDGQRAVARATAMVEEAAQEARAAARLAEIRSQMGVSLPAPAEPTTSAEENADDESGETEGDVDPPDGDLADD